MEFFDTLVRHHVEYGTSLQRGLRCMGVTKDHDNICDALHDYLAFLEASRALTRPSTQKRAECLLCGPHSQQIVLDGNMKLFKSVSLSLRVVQWLFAGGLCVARRTAVCSCTQAPHQRHPAPHRYKRRHSRRRPFVVDSLHVPKLITSFAQIASKSL